ncbi:MAG: hypothetical protein K9G58_06575 [Bacteroidales bacterium]|nr:hypothetical protein [Bacteroidales bacterium]MCF8386442.1 hypothetical protein [Bacteroidales bacterium]MCF8397814.1 hypothetical protein [Bacteroidales bacterium]
MAAVLIKQDNYLQEVERFVEDVCNQYSLTDSYFGNILISVLEAIDILKGKETKEISINQEKEKMLSISFSLEGEKVPDLLREMEDEAEEKSIFLIEMLTDQVEVSNDQKSISLCFDIGGLFKQKAEHRRKKLSQYYQSAEKLQHKNH